MSMTPGMMQSQAKPIHRYISLAKLIVCCTLCSASKWKLNPKKKTKLGARVKIPALVSLLFVEFV